MGNLERILPFKSPASELPPELLSRIFMFNKGALLTQRTFPNFEDTQSVYYGIISTRFTSQVCRSWRNTAIEYPFLWNNMIDFDYMRGRSNWTLILLERCRGVPLVVKIAGPVLFPPWTVGSPRHVSPPGWVLLFENLDRVRKLDVTLYDCNIADPSLVSIYNRLKQPALALEKLYLGALFTGRDVNAPTFPTSIFAGIAPCLRRLELKNIILGSTLSYDAFRGLVSLSVTLDSYTHTTTASQWLKLLAVTPLLQKLEIHEKYAAWSRLEHAPVQDVRLDHLAQLRLTKVLGGCVDLLQHLIFPPPCLLTIECSEVIPGADYRALHAILLPKLSWSAGRAPAEPIEIHAHDRRMSIESSPGSAFAFRIGFEADIFPGLAGTDFDPPLISLLAPFSYARELYLECDDDEDVFITAILGVFTMAITLHTVRSTDALISAMLFGFAAYCLSALAPPRDIQLPALTRINSGSPLDTKATCKQLLQLLKAREEMGHPIETFEIFSYYADSLIDDLNNNLGLDHDVFQRYLVLGTGEMEMTQYCSFCGIDEE